MLGKLPILTKLLPILRRIVYLLYLAPLSRVNNKLKDSAESYFSEFTDTKVTIKRIIGMEARGLLSGVGVKKIRRHMRHPRLKMP
jgi:hypothetical protein